METLQLNSNDSLSYFPGNTPSEFTVNVQPPIPLDGKWKVGIREVSYSSSVILGVKVHFLDKKGVTWGEAGPVDGFLSISQVKDVPRRNSTPVATYDLSDLLELSTKHTHPKQWSRHHKRKTHALTDIPNIRVRKMVIKGMVTSRVSLVDDDGRRYLQRYYDHPTLSGEDLMDPIKSNKEIYDAATSLPRKPLPGDYVKEGAHTAFSFSDVGTLAYNKRTQRYTLTCIENGEGVGGIAITLGNKTIAKSMMNAQSRFDEEFHDVLAIHSDLVMPQQQLGDRSTDLLAIVPRVAKVWKNNYSHMLYKKIRYVPLCQTYLTKLKIQFKSIRGDSIQFPPSVQTSITLELKRWD